jgi:transposase
LERCPDCGYRLRGESIDYVRQVVELAPAPPVEVVEHQVIKRYCPHCRRWRSPKLELRGQVLGQGRMGVRLASLIVYLQNTQRLPLEGIREYLGTIHGLAISDGEIVRLLHGVRRVVEPVVEGLKQQARASPVLHGDETGWREGGHNGYIWGFMTAGEQAIRYYEYDASRGGAVAKRIVGAQFDGCLVTDFYAAYNDIACAHQRCWVHLLRDLHKLRERYAQERKVVNWARAVGGLYEQAQGWLKRNRDATGEERGRQYAKLVGRVRRLGLLYAQVKRHPCRALAKRVMRHEEELFQFVVVAGLAGHNNLAERGLRPLVVVRKISGGSRSEEGTKTRMVLASLFGTWRARGLNAFVECVKLLSQPTPPLSQTPLPQL